MRYRLYDDHVADLLAAIRHHSEHASAATTRPRSSSAPPASRAR
jgi:hypothetical protein